MKIVLGLESLSPPRTGIGRYTAGLLQEYLSRQLAVAGLLHGELIDRPEILARLAAETKPAQDWRGPAWRRALSFLPGVRSAWQMTRNLRSRIVGRRLREAIYHEPNYIAPRLPCPLVVTVHDLSHLRFPDYHPRARVRWLERYLPRTLARAGKIITVSEFSRGEILHVLGLAPEKVAAIPLGVEERFRPLPAEAAQRRLQRYGLRFQGYLLAVGTLEPRKNLGRLLDAYSLLPDCLRCRFPLVLIGPKGWRTESLWPKLDRFERRGEVRWLGYVDEDDLPSLYCGSAVFAYLSLYEGFGLPVLEAMGCGAAVLTSQGSAMAEWGGEAAWLVDPWDVEAIALALRQLLEDPSLVGRLRALGPAWARRFSWGRCAEQTLEVYAEVIHG
ncbi:glycosyltransferase family 1 protein [Methylothermus subterraneus]